ncbi:hypothetical protein EDC96DRAFT_550434 [Choanephora cucurbitarum]|nr:hypothetical protein EDC96DRAFT_550434 [Choanephora cucurbitarum]
MHRQIPTVATSSSRPAARSGGHSTTRPNSGSSSRPVAPAPVDPVSLPAAPLPLSVAPFPVAPLGFQRDEVFERIGDRIDRLEALMTAPQGTLLPKRRGHGRNPDFVDERVDSPVYNRVLELASARIRNFAGLGPHQHLSVAMMRSIDARICNRFDNARRRVRPVALSEHARLEMAREEAKRRRLQRISKQFQRDCFNTSPEVLYAGFDSVKECAGLLDIAYIFDEEVEGEIFGRSFRVFVPSWRSDMLTEFYQFLDRIRLQNSTSFRGPRNRKVVEQALPDELRQRLPR